MKNKWVLFNFFVLLFLVLFSCEKNNETKISSFGSDDSHKAGQNCMNCHKKGDSGEGWFIVAGTVYNSQLEKGFENAIIKFYTESNGKGILKSTIKGDILGNFYTTENIEFGSGLFVGVEGELNVKYMTVKVTNGQCNSCHGNSTIKIWTE